MQISATPVSEKIVVRKEVAKLAGVSHDAIGKGKRESVECTSFSIAGTKMSGQYDMRIYAPKSPNRPL